MSLMKKAFYLGLGALSLTKEKAEKVIKELEEKGEMSREEGKEFLDEVVKKGEEQKKEIQDMISKGINDFGVVKRSELAALEERIKKIEDKLSQ